MAKIKWDETGKHFYETGTKNGVLYVQNVSDGGTATYQAGVAWNGLTGFSESPDGGDANDIYADDMKYLSLRSAENFKGTITAYTYPEEFMVCDGSATFDGVPGVSVGQQTRRSFGFSYVTSVGNDILGDSYGEKLHIIWNASASPSSKDYKTINDSPEAIEFSWEITTIPVVIEGHDELKPTAHMVIDTTKLTGGKENAQYLLLKNKLYGTDGSGSGGAGGTDPELPDPAGVITLMTPST